jgi:hypothetical protein
MIYLISLPNHKKHQNINGNSLMSEKIYSRYFKLNEDLLLNATSDSNIKNKIKKIYLIIKSVLLIITRQQKSVYTVLYDYKGLYLQIIFLYIVSFFCKKIIVHHHSFRYLIDKKIIKLLRSKNITHIASSKKQYFKLKKNYSLKKIYFVPNYIFILDENIKIISKNKINRLKIFYYSRINESKGISDYIRIVEEMNGNKKIIFNVFGNECSNNYKEKILSLKKIGKIKKFKLNINQKYQKKIFTEHDILIFPTKHTSETTPMVIDECINYGVVPISYNKGDIKGQIGKLNLVVNNYTQMKKKILKNIKNFKNEKKKIIKDKENKKNKTVNYFKVLDNIFMNK